MNGPIIRGYRPRARPSGRAGAFRQRGVSLIEALVAFGVMAFGMMAVVGMQATLRGSGDLARQRAEAVRIAQDAVETWRGFSTLDATANRMAYADIVTVGSTDVVRNYAGDNTTYQLRRRVNAEPVVSGTLAAQRLTLVVDVGWEDRAGQAHTVRLASSIAGIEPELTASMMLGANPDPVVAPRGRQRGIPPSAVPLGQGRSGFVPPGQTGTGPRVAWVFNNTTGVITLCSTNGLSTSELLFTGNAPTCGTSLALLLTGSVRYTGANVNSLPQSVANPDGVGFPDFGVEATQTLTDGTASIATCYLDAAVSDTQRSYYCAMRITATDAKWTGQLAFTSPLPISSSLADPSAANYKVCRYHAAASYTDVKASLVNQNYVIVKAGDGSTAYACPTSSTPRTWAHQPTS